MDRPGRVRPLRPARVRRTSAVTPVLTVLAVLAAGHLVAPVAPVGAVGAVAVDASPTATADREAAPVLRRAVSALTGDAVGARPDATLALRDLYVAGTSLAAPQRQAAARVLARPTDGGSDPYGDGYDSASVSRCSTHVCLHWVRTGADAPPSTSWPTTTLGVLEQVWRHHVDTLGYRAPLGDGQRGGNAKLDVYLKDVGNRGLYGYCAPEQGLLGSGKQASGYCVLDDDFARAQFGRDPIDALRVTAAHEFFHAIQFAYDVTEDAWLYETTATWMEEQFADSVDDNRGYLRYGQLVRPRVPLDLYEDSGLAQYGNWLFWEFLGRRHGSSIVRQVWNQAGSGGGLPDDYSVEALAHVLASRGGLTSAYAAFAAGNTVPSRTYAEGSAYPTAPVTERAFSTGSRRYSLATRLDHLTSRAVRLRPTSSLGAGWRITVALDAPDRTRGSAAYVVVRRTDGGVGRRTLPLSSTGAGRTVLAFDRSVASVTVVLVNASTRYRCDQRTSLACQGTSYDDALRYEVRASVAR